jgi:hypothetical protein
LFISTENDDEFDIPSEKDATETLRRESMTRRKRPNKKNPGK